jgi:hypothetical protein
MYSVPRCGGRAAHASSVVDPRVNAVLPPGFLPDVAIGTGPLGEHEAYSRDQQQMKVSPARVSTATKATTPAGALRQAAYPTNSSRQGPSPGGAAAMEAGARNFAACAGAAAGATAAQAQFRPAPQPNALSAQAQQWQPPQQQKQQPWLQRQQQQQQQQQQPWQQQQHNRCVSPLGMQLFNGQYTQQPVMGNPCANQMAGGGNNPTNMYEYGCADQMNDGLPQQGGGCTGSDGLWYQSASAGLGGGCGGVRGDEAGGGMGGGGAKDKDGGAGGADQSPHMRAQGGASSGHDGGDGYGGAPGGMGSAYGAGGEGYGGGGGGGEGGGYALEEGREQQRGEATQTQVGCSNLAASRQLLGSC